MDPTTPESPPVLGEPAPTTSDNGPSIEQMIAEAEAAAPAVTTPAEGEPSTETKPEAEAKPAEEPKAEEKAEAKDDGISEKRARKILDAAHRKHKAAETHTQTFVQNVKRELMTDPSAALEKYFGTTLDNLIDVSTGVTPAERTETKPETSARDAELDRRLARIEQREAQAAYDAKAAEIKGAVAADAKAFPTINARGKQAVVIDFMEEYFREHGSPIAWKEAAKLVESELKEWAGGGEATKAEPAKVATTAVTPPKPTTALTNGDVRTTAPVDDEPSDPDELIKFLTQKEEARLSRRAS